MDHPKNPLQLKKVLYLQYISLIEEAYNLNQADHAQSDIASFEADKILKQINAIEFTSEANLV